MRFNELVTIAVPTYNRSNYLQLAIASALAQTYATIEVLVSDNCSVDNTPEVISSFSDTRLRYYRQECNLGMVGNWNFCLQQAKGAYFILLSDDDLLVADAIENFVSNFNNKSISLVYSSVTYIDEYEEIKGHSRKAPTFESGESFIANSFKMVRQVYPSATMHRTDLARQLGGYHDIGTTTDFALRLSIAALGDVGHIPRPLVCYRVHQQSLTSSLDMVSESFTQLQEWLTLPINVHLLRYQNLFHSYRKEYLYSLGISLVISGSDDVAECALARLNTMSYDLPRRIALKLFTFKVVRSLLLTARGVKHCYMKIRTRKTYFSEFGLSVKKCILGE